MEIPVQSFIILGFVNTYYLPIHTQVKQLHLVSSLWRYIGRRLAAHSLSFNFMIYSALPKMNSLKKLGVSPSFTVYMERHS